MGYPLRMLEANKVYTVMSRTHQERYLLRPDPKTTKVVRGVLARCPHEHPAVKLHGMTTMSNHIHMDVSTSDPTQVAANAPDVTVGSVAGVWNASVSGQGCRIATPQTKYGQGFRAGPLRCPTPLDGVKSWNVEGKQLALYDENGQVLARLYSSGAERFDGQTSSGQPVSLTR